MMRWGFVAASAFNLGGMLVHTRAFTQFPATELYPGLFGVEGCLAIMLWGLAYGAVANHWQRLPALCAVFVLEKALYVGSWVYYWSTTPLSLAEHQAQHPGAATLLAVYGVGDLLFGLFFAAAAVTAWRVGSSPTA